jgi:hypothetical protein
LAGQQNPGQTRNQNGGNRSTNRGERHEIWKCS